MKSKAGVLGVSLLAIGCLSGCGIVGALGYASYKQGEAEGKLPPMSLARRCVQESMVRDEAKGWVQDKTLTRECMAKEGW